MPVFRRNNQMMSQTVYTVPISIINIVMFGISYILHVTVSLFTSE